MTGVFDVELSYSGKVTPVTTSTDPDTGVVTTTPGTPTTGVWFGSTLTNDIAGRVRADYSTDGAAYADTDTRP